MKFLFNIFLWIWSHFPVFCLSCDDNFATLDCTTIKKYKSKLRLSLLNLMMGNWILYLVTFDIKNRKFRLYDILSLNGLESLSISDEKINEIQEEYKEHIRNLSKEEIGIEKEKLIYHIQNESSRIDTSISKINTYTTVILTGITIVLAITNLKNLVKMSLPISIFMFFIAYSLLNIFIYIFYAIKVGGIKKSSFNDLCSSQEKDRVILLQYQYDWKQLEYKARLFVSFVINIQEWFILMFTLLLIVLISNLYFDNNKIDKNIDIDYSAVITVNLNEIDIPFSYSSVEWKKFLLRIEERKCKSVVFLINPYEEISFVYELDKYKDLDRNVYKDETIEKDTLKIIMEDE